MTGWVAALAECERRAEACVLVTVLEAAGSTPREVGAKMVVTADRLVGTIGGGALEFTAIEAARTLLGSDEAAPRTQRLALGPSLGQCCGGAVTLLYEPVRLPALRVLLFGAGHVAQALVGVLAHLPCRIWWVDSRPETFPASLPPSVTAIVAPEPEAEVAVHSAASHVLIMTHDHALDLRLTEAALAAGRFAYVGLIGSRTKRVRFERRLTARGLEAAALAHLTCPIGVSGVTGKQPGAVAIAVAAQLLQTLPAPAAKRAAPAARLRPDAGKVPEAGCADCAVPCADAPNAPRLRRRLRPLRGKGAGAVRRNRA